MDGPGSMSSDILGIEVGRTAVRGVRLDQETTELTDAAECAFDPAAICGDGIIDPAHVGPSLEVLLHRLGVEDRSRFRVGMTIGPRNSGVGSGPAMAGWLSAQADNLGESITCSGGLGIAFVPSRAIDAAVKLALGCGIDLVRVDLAPVAGARAIGDQVEDVIYVGSGRGWQARMRDFEVLEAMETAEVGVDAPLYIVASNGAARSIGRYGWVEVSAELDQAQRLEIGQLAPAVGVAIGVAYESPANLLLGREVTHAAPQRPTPLPTPAVQRGGTDRNDLSLTHFDDYELNGNGAEATLQLAKTEVDDHTKVEPAQRQHQHQRPRQPQAEAQPRRMPERAAAEPGMLVDPISTPTPKPASGTRLPVERAKRVAPPRTGRPTSPVVADHGGAPPLGMAGAAGTAVATQAVAAESSAADAWGESVDESDPITMFSPDTEVRHMMGKRDSRLGPDVLFVLLLVSAVALLLAYLYL